MRMSAEIEVASIAAAQAAQKYWIIERPSLGEIAAAQAAQKRDRAA